MNLVTHIMFYPSSKHHFDTMFVILCVVAGATSHTISNTSKTPINQLNNHYRASFIDFILDASLVELLLSSKSINKDMATTTTQYSPLPPTILPQPQPPPQPPPTPTDHKSTATKSHQQSQTACALLSHLLTSNQMKFCRQHQDVLEIILPEIIEVTKRECARITTDLKWNCSSIDHLLDRSNPLAFTREAALVRSILNASMMYLVVKSCSRGNVRSCGCQYNQSYLEATSTASRMSRRSYDILSSADGYNETSTVENASILSIDHPNISPSDLSRLDAGSPLRLTKSMVQRQGCMVSTAFANAFTKVFIDTDDSKALNKAYRVLNENPNYYRLNNNVSYNVKRLVDSDMRDLAYIKWGKSAINLHNNHVGRQLVREAIQRRCRCHGISGVCQFQTCWDDLLDFEAISSRLRLAYLNKSIKVDVKNYGTNERPDLCLTRFTHNSNPTERQHKAQELKDLQTLLADPSPASSNRLMNHDKVKYDELLYLHESPDYCESQPRINHLGTKGRSCEPKNNLEQHVMTYKQMSIRSADSMNDFNHIDTKESLDGAPGSCEHLCCNRGYNSELILEMVTCNCRFKFCCQVDCGQCLQQRVQHFCQ